MLQVIQKNDVLVVDSRLVAGELGVTIKSFHETIRKYQTKIESQFGAMPFETETRLDGNKGGYQPVFYWLNEDHLLFIMTLSRNTEKVVEWKASLVKAFSEAKKKLEKPIMTQTELVLYSAQKLVEQERKLKQLEQEQLQLREQQLKLNESQQSVVNQQEDMDNRLTTVEVVVEERSSTRCDWYTVAGFSKKIGQPTDLMSLQKKGRQCSRKSHELGYELKTVNDPRWGEVGLYHLDILNIVFNSNICGYIEV